MGSFMEATKVNYSGGMSDAELSRVTRYCGVVATPSGLLHAVWTGYEDDGANAASKVVD